VSKFWGWPKFVELDIQIEGDLLRWLHFLSIL
jgi:hypothetical protein